MSTLATVVYRIVSSCAKHSATPSEVLGAALAVGMDVRMIDVISAMRALNLRVTDHTRGGDDPCDLVYVLDTSPRKQAPSCTGRITVSGVISAKDVEREAEQDRRPR